MSAEDLGLLFYMQEVVWEDFKYPGSRMIKSVFKKFANNGKNIK